MEIFAFSIGKSEPGSSTIVWFHVQITFWVLGFFGLVFLKKFAKTSSRLDFRLKIQKY